MEEKTDREQGTVNCQERVVGRAMSDIDTLRLESLEVWKKSLDLAVVIYKEILPQLPVEEKWSLNQQMRRSVSSISANIAEGYGRFYYQDNVHFCYIARGSLVETSSHLTLAFKLGFIPKGKYQELKMLVNELARLISGYIAYLKKSKNGANEPGANHYIREDITPYMIEDINRLDSAEDH